MTRKIELAFKATLDYQVSQLASSLSAANPANKPVLFFDLDDSSTERQVQAGAEHALVYQYTHLSEDPTHPLYSVLFLVGAKTTADEGNYDMTSLLTDVRSLFRTDMDCPLFDYSAVGEGDDPGEQEGVLIVQSVDTGPQMFEKQSGIRLLQITGKVIAYGAD